MLADGEEASVDAGTMVVVAPGATIEVVDVSDDFTVSAIASTTDRLSLVSGLCLPDGLLHARRVGIVRPEAEERAAAESAFRVVWFLACREAVRRRALDDAASAVVHVFLETLIRCGLAASAPAPGSGEELLSDFLSLVRVYGHVERQVSFYADRLCKDANYVGQVVGRVSGTPAKDWINGVSREAALDLLRNTSLSVEQISRRLKFRTPESFTHWFKYQMGVPPQTWRERRCGA